MEQHDEEHDDTDPDADNDLRSGGRLVGRFNVDDVRPRNGLNNFSEIGNFLIRHEYPIRSDAHSVLDKYVSLGSW